MNINNLNALLGAYQSGATEGASKTQKSTTSKSSFVEQFQDTKSSDVEEYTKYLKSKYGGNIMIQDIGNDQRSLDSLGARTYGSRNIVISPKILEEMATNPEKAAYYEEKIQYLFDSQPMIEAEFAAMGHEIHSRGVIIKPDGTVVYYVSGDLKPEKRAEIEAKVKSETEKKAERWKEYMELNEEAAKERRLLMEQCNISHMLMKALQSQVYNTDEGEPMAVKSPVTAPSIVTSSFLSSMMF